jgi:hypothetical protein
MERYRSRFLRRRQPQQHEQQQLVECLDEVDRAVAAEEAVADVDHCHPNKVKSSLLRMPNRRMP